MLTPGFSGTTKVVRLAHFRSAVTLLRRGPSHFRDAVPFLRRTVHISAVPFLFFWGEFSTISGLEASKRCNSFGLDTFVGMSRG